MLGRLFLRYRITDSGRERAGLFLESNHYVGVAPVPFEQYRQHAELRKAGRALATREARARGVFPPGDQPARADQLGPAINAGHSMFVRPAWQRKDCHLASRRTAHAGRYRIPHAVEVEG